MNGDLPKIFISSNTIRNQDGKSVSPPETSVHSPMAVPLDEFSGSEIQFESEAVQFLKIVFNFGYYLLCIPFRFSFNGLKRVYEPKSHRLQHILIILNSGVIGGYFLLKLIKMMSQANHLAEYFEIAYYFCDTIYLIILLFIFGRKSKEFQAIFGELQENWEHQDSSSRRKFTSLKKTRIAATLISSLCFGAAICSILESYSQADWSIPEAYKNLETDALDLFSRYCSGVTELSLNKTELNATSTLSRGTFSAALVFLNFWSTCFEHILNVFSDVLFTMTALTFHCLARQFLEQLRRDGGAQSETVIKSYRKLKNSTELLNSTMSLIIGSFIIGNLPFYVTNVSNIFSANANIFLKIRYLIYCSYYFPSLILAAKSCGQVDHNMKIWMSEAANLREVPFLDVSLLLHEVNNQPVAISAFGCLHVNFSLVASEISLILTYAVLKSQFHQNTNPTCKP